MTQPFAQANISTAQSWVDQQHPSIHRNGSSAQTTATPPNINHQITWTLTSPTPVGRALVSAGQRLHESGVENPRLDAQVLLAHVLGQERSWLFAHHEYELNGEEAERYTDLVARRANREPVAYLIGRKEFYGLEFHVDRRVLIPRPETELLVDLTLAQIRNRCEGCVVVDVGTGSGAIAITTAIHAPKAQVYGLDLSKDALSVARTNANRLAPDASLTLLQSDLLDALPEPADLIVANLPYITAEDYQDLAPDIRQYEPRLALEAGPEGLDVIQRLLQQVADHLKPDGAVLLEIGAEQGESVAKLAKQLTPHPSYVGLRRDYSGRIRMVTLEF